MLYRLPEGAAAGSAPARRAPARRASAHQSPRAPSPPRPRRPPPPHEGAPPARASSASNSSKDQPSSPPPSASSSSCGGGCCAARLRLLGEPLAVLVASAGCRHLLPFWLPFCAAARRLGGMKTNRPDAPAHKWHADAREMPTRRRMQMAVAFAGACGYCSPCVAGNAAAGRNICTGRTAGMGTAICAPKLAGVGNDAASEGRSARAASRQQTAR